ncbi:MAG TPA: diaminopimelate epimerase [Myxococcaceae bacterium]
MGERLHKYQGLGNDFVVLDRRQTGRDIGPAESVRLCDRRLGVGADGVLVLLPSPGAAARMVVHNADGSIAEMCGNGIRCAVKYLLDTAQERPRSVDVDTGAGRLRCDVTYGSDGRVSLVEVSMGPARLQAPNLPGPSPFIQAELPGAPGVRGTAISMGNPHLVLFGQPLTEATRLGPKLETHPLFPERTNVEFVELVSPREVRIVVWERGVGLTQACGTGACATAAAGVMERRLPAGEWITAHLPGGQLQICVAEDLSDVRMRGPATLVFWAETP